jgi:hypothetical protein
MLIWVPRCNDPKSSWGSGRGDAAEGGAQGTAFFLKSVGFVTASHCVEGATEIAVYHPSKPSNKFKVTVANDGARISELRAGRQDQRSIRIDNVVAHKERRSDDRGDAKTLTGHVRRSAPR